MNPRAYGIVRLDIARSSADGYVADIRAMAVDRQWDLRAVFVEPSDAWFPLLVSSLGLSGTGLVVVPSSLHLGGWMDVVRQSVDVWTLYPRLCWPRRTLGCHEGGHADERGRTDSRLP
ncbi:hypothetical protein [Nocardia mexicana]|uniref:hypothetical protein n=1 Tax=Nocardia mexicana TaxID=279262 RepID=UPI0011C02FFD|nr:hypothetical protein [Nocardia mexicana]